jgi:SIR2-like domain
MTEVMVQELRAYSALVAFILGQLQAAKGVKGIAPIGEAHGIDVEQFANAVALLEERDTLELSPFVGTWSPQLVELDRGSSSLHRTRAVRQLFEQMASGLQISPPSRSSAARASIASHGFLHQEFENAVRAVLGHAERGRGLSELRNAMVSVVLRTARVKDPGATAYLSPLLRLCQYQDNRLVIATLNYDDTIEQLAASQSIACDDAIDAWHARGELGPPDDGQGIFLLKLHGSVTWSLLEHKCVRATPGLRGARSAIIFGGRNKLTAEGPYLDLLLAFRRELARSQRVTAVGYSFRDEHVSGYVERWLAQSPHNQLRVVDPSARKAITDSSRSDARRWLLKSLQVEWHDQRAEHALAGLFP